MNYRAIIIVDVQNDFCPGGSLAVSNGDEIIPAINSGIAEARLRGDGIIFTRDWHPPVTSHFKKDGGIWPVHCVRGTHGAEFHPVLDTRRGIIISKGMLPDQDSFSGFDDPHFLGPDLHATLRFNNIHELLIGGLATDYCVKATVLDAIRLGYKTKFMGKWSRAVNLQKGDEEKAIQEMDNAGAICELDV